MNKGDSSLQVAK